MGMSIAIVSQKGGVGKSTIVCNLAAVSAVSGRRTLVVDLDPQANASHYLLGRRVAELSPNLAGFFEQTLGFRLFREGTQGFVHKTRFKNLEIMPAHIEMESLQSKLEAKYKIYKLRDALDVSPRTLDDELRHVERSLRGSGRRLAVAGPLCRDCGFSFPGRARRHFHPPGRCPKCKHERISAPRFRIT